MNLQGPRAALSALETSVLAQYWASPWASCLLGCALVAGEAGRVINAHNSMKAHVGEAHIASFLF